MEISYRLKCIADEVQFKRIADVGTDHAYIPIYLCREKNIEFAIASDINKMPLERAKENIATYNCSDKIEARLGSGIENIGDAEVETVIIAGMGGMLINGILNKEQEKTKSYKQLVLQPQLDIEAVRRTLHNLEYKIINETMICENEKFYTIINAIRGIEEPYSESEYLWGKILLNKKDKYLKKYIELELKKQDLIIKSLIHLETEVSKERVKELEKLKEKHEEVYRCL